jgi:hypothetical protein
VKDGKYLGEGDSPLRQYSDSLYHLTTLRILKLKDGASEIVSDDTLATFTGLHTLTLQFNHHITSLSLSKLTNLTSLSMPGDSCMNALDILALPVSIKKLNVRHCKSPDALQSIATRLTSLQYLTLDIMTAIIKLRKQSSWSHSASFPALEQLIVRRLIETKDCHNDPLLTKLKRSVAMYLPGIEVRWSKGGK